MDCANRGGNVYCRNNAIGTSPIKRCFTVPKSIHWFWDSKNYFIGLASIPTISTVNILALIRQIHTLNTYILVSTMEGKIYPHSTNGWYILESPWPSVRQNSVAIISVPGDRINIKLGMHLHIWWAKPFWCLSYINFLLSGTLTFSGSVMKEKFSVKNIFAPSDGNDFKFGMNLHIDEMYVSLLLYNINFLFRETWNEWGIHCTTTRATPCFACSFALFFV